MEQQCCEQGLRLLLEKYQGYVPDGLCFEESEEGPVLIADGQRVPLHPWRQNRKLQQLKAVLQSGQAGQPSVLRTGHIQPQTNSLTHLFAQELDLCEWLLESPIKALFAVCNRPAANLVVTLENGTVCALELATTLAPGQPLVERHEINTRRGIISDQVVDTQTSQASVYLYGTEGEERYTDIDFELYGLTSKQTQCVRDGFYALVQQDACQRRQHRQHLARLTKAVYTSAEQGCRVTL